MVLSSKEQLKRWKLKQEKSKNFQNFNPPTSPYMGGEWERGIKTVEDVLCDMIKSTVLTEIQLCKMFKENEVIVNNRPLTTVSDSPDVFEA